MYKVILVPLDGSKRAEAILPHVENISSCFNAEVIFFIVEEPALLLEHDEVIDFSKYMTERDQQKQRTESYLSSVQEKFQAKGIKARTLIGRGQVVKSIVEIAEREKVELVAMASHGHSGSIRTFYGSVAAGVLQRIDRPLLLIRTRRN
jgi:nucleotide-binding universal stress UspA family protein